MWNFNDVKFRSHFLAKQIFKTTLKLFFLLWALHKNKNVSSSIECHFHGLKGLKDEFYLYGKLFFSLSQKLVNLISFVELLSKICKRFKKEIRKYSKWEKLKVLSNLIDIKRKLISFNFFFLGIVIQNFHFIILLHTKK